MCAPMTEIESRDKTAKFEPKLSALPERVLLLSLALEFMLLLMPP